MRRNLLALGALAAALVACSLAFPVPDAKPDAVPGTDAAARADSTSGEGGVTPVTTLACDQTGRGPSLIPAGARVCVDRTAVTREQYASFVAANVPFTGQLAGCEGNTSWTPVGTSPTPDTPVHGVDWCDAWAFCAWAGKTLCGGFPGDAPSPPNGDAGLNHGIVYGTANDRAASAYAWACEAGDEARTYPYSNDPDATQCYHVTIGQRPDPPPVGSTGCEGGFPELVDMVGIDEWIDSCSNDRCNLAGNQVCRGLDTLPADITKNGLYSFLPNVVGFRCCGLAAPSSK